MAVVICDQQFADAALLGWCPVPAGGQARELSINRCWCGVALRIVSSILSEFKIVALWLLPLHFLPKWEFSGGLAAAWSRLLELWPFYYHLGRALTGAFYCGTLPFLAPAVGLTRHLLVRFFRLVRKVSGSHLGFLVHIS
ncbi:MAG: hypothetical protein ACTJLL_04270 [Anaplasma sp.]